MIAKFTVTPGTPAPMFSVIYTEPTKDVNGNPITDLAFVSVFYTVAGRTTEAAKLGAISPTGGEEGSWRGYIGVLPGAKETIEIWTTSSDKNGNESDKSQIFSFVVDNTGDPIKVTAPPMPPS